MIFLCVPCRAWMQLLVGLVSAYRYEGPRVSEETARAEAKALVAAVKSAGHAAAKLVENDDVVRILTTRSKPHLVETFKHYKEIHGRHIEEVTNQSNHDELINRSIDLIGFFVRILGTRRH